MGRHTFRYDIHGIVTVLADARLPELETFHTSRPLARPTIRLRIGRVAPSAPATPGLRGRRIAYREGLKSLGFGIEITYGSSDDTVDIVATPLVARSPHVLYTNVVEPILRWTFVDKGYALVHGACLARGDDAFLITARTDTGKTTTVLRALDHQPTWRFLSDDLTLIDQDGGVLPYPKPMTISRHTLVAVKTPLLSRRERAALLIQSRLHSKSGRRFGLLLAATRLPMATTNAIVQALIPPPKYPVERLVPGVQVAPRARLAGVVVIERGADAQVALNQREAVEILMSNCEDSYGFPPYPAIKSFLYGARGHDLRLLEKATVSAALTGLPATLLRSETRDWWQQLPSFFDEAVEAQRATNAPVEFPLPLSDQPVPISAD